MSFFRNLSVVGIIFFFGSYILNKVNNLELELYLYAGIFFLILFITMSIIIKKNKIKS